MLRKIFIRMFLVGAGLFCALLLAVAFAVCLALGEPAFYAQLRESSVVDPLLTSRMEVRTRDFESWARKSSAVARGLVRSNPLPQWAASLPPTYCLDMTEKQLNSVLASDRYRAGDVRNPRVQLLDEMLRVGAEVAVGESQFIFSFDVKPKVDAHGALQLEIVAARLGSLRLPLRTLLKLTSKFVNEANADFQIDVSGKAPVVTFKKFNRGRKSVVVDSVRCTPAMIAIEFKSLPPPDRSGDEL